MQSDQLKPCPFCEATCELVGGRIHARHAPYCIMYSHIVYDFKRTSWNTRPIEDALRAELEQAKAKLARVEGLAGKWIATEDSCMSDDLGEEVLDVLKGDGE